MDGDLNNGGHKYDLRKQVGASFCRSLKLYLWKTMLAEFPVKYYWLLVSISFLLFDNQPKIVCFFILYFTC